MEDEVRLALRESVPLYSVRDPPAEHPKVQELQDETGKVPRRARRSKDCGRRRITERPLWQRFLNAPVKRKC